MNTTLFVHDGPMMYDPGTGCYFAVHYNNEIVNRYLHFGDEVTFLMRKKVIGSASHDNFSKMSHEKFNFNKIPDFKSIQSYLKKGEAKQIIRDAVEKSDVILARIPSAAGTIAFNYARELNKPVLVECVACVFDALWNYNWKGKLLAHYKYYQMKNVLKRATHTIYVTSEFLQSRYPTDGKAIGCSDVVLKPLTDDVLEARLQKVKNRREKPLVVGTVAALNVPYKGQGDVIKAIGKLKAEGFRVEYKLVGQGDASHLKNLIKKYDIGDRIEIVGPLKHDEVFTFLDDIDVYIQPSRQEGLPRAMVEAMSRACLVMGANTAGIPELIEDKFVFEAGDTNRMNDIILGLESGIMINQAKRNFNEAKKYQASVLNRKRISFYDEFMNDYEITPTVR
jgi:glycosyltransferase involved in cell wall biosynthesis